MRKSYKDESRMRCRLLRLGRVLRKPGEGRNDFEAWLSSQRLPPPPSCCNDPYCVRLATPLGSSADADLRSYHSIVASPSPRV
jgi:hypothetical protein